MKDTNVVADRIIDISFFVLTLTSLLVSPIHSTFTFALPIVILLLGTYYLIKKVIKNSDLYQYVASANLALFTALLIYQMHGMIEMHFLAFIGAILLIQYKKWQLQLLITILVVIHHSVFAYIQFIGYKEIYFIVGEYMDLQTFIVHVVLAAIIFFLCGYWAHIFNQNSEEIKTKNVILQNQMESISVNLDVASEISNGNFNVAFDNLKSNDKLSSLLQGICHNLKSNAIKDEERNWIAQGSVEIGKILLKNQQNADVLYRDIIKFIVRYLNINQGGLFVLNDQNKDDVFIELASNYAFDTDKKNISRRIELQDTSIGEAIKDVETVYVSQIPTDYVEISSGLGHAKLGFLVIVPLKINEKAYGAIELISFAKIDSYKIKFVETIATSIATTMSSASKNTQTSYLLHEMQIQEEHLRSQEEELRQNMEEMQATQEELLRKDIEISAVMRAIDESQAKIEFDLYGNIIFANEILLSSLKFTLDDVVGKHHRIFVDKEYSLSQEYTEFWASLRNGQSKSGNFLRKASDGTDVWLFANYSPIKDTNGNIIRILKLAREITNEKKLEMEIKKSMDAMKIKEIEIVALLEAAKQNEIKIEAMAMKNLELSEEMESKIEVLELKLKKKDIKIAELTANPS